MKSVIDVGVDRMGDAVGAGVLSLFLTLSPGGSGAILTSACACSVIAACWLFQCTPGLCLALEKPGQSRHRARSRAGGRLDHAFAADANN